MTLPRWLLAKKVTGRINRMMELFLPPVIIDRKWVACLFNGLQGRGFRYYDVTKDPVSFPRCTRGSDCTRAQIKAAAELAVGTSVLDIGCGTGCFLRELATRGFRCVGIDPNQAAERSEGWEIRCGFVEDLALEDGSFDTVVSFKTLEHIPDAKDVLRTWKMIARRRIILILPCQRYRRYVYDGHIHFFPDEFQLRMQLGLSEAAIVTKIDHDWLIYEDVAFSKK